MEKIKIEIKAARFLELLQILFIGLKLTNQIGWSWYLVLMPIIGSFIISGISIIIGILAAILSQK